MMKKSLLDNYRFDSDADSGVDGDDRDMYWPL